MSPKIIENLGTRSQKKIANPFIGYVDVLRVSSNMARAVALGFTGFKIASSVVSSESTAMSHI
jgi:hypothetical protein